VQEIINSVLSAAATALELIGALIILGAAAQVTVFIVVGLVREHTVSLGAWRSSLGKGLVLGLEFLIGADVLRTILAPSLEELALLGGVVLLRTILSFSIEFELRQIEKRSGVGEESGGASPHSVRRHSRTKGRRA
jgi:uncharacterized membrane protein